MPILKLIKCGKSSSYKDLTLEEYENLTDDERKEYVKQARNDNGYRMDIIKKILVMFDFEIKDNMIDISFVYNLSDRELLLLYKLLYGEVSELKVYKFNDADIVVTPFNLSKTKLWYSNQYDEVSSVEEITDTDKIVFEEDNEESDKVCLSDELKKNKYKYILEPIVVCSTEY